MKRIVYLFIVITLNYLVSYAQENTDSLLFKINSIDGKKKVDKLNQLADSILYENIGSSRQFADEALTLSEKLNYLKGKGYALENKGKIAFITGNLSDAIDTFEDALSIADNLDEVFFEIRIHRWLARVYEESNALNKSLDHYDLYYSFSQQFDNKVDMALALIGKGDIYYRLEKLPIAIDNYSGALKLFEDVINKQGRLKTLVKLAMVQSELDNNELARHYFRQADVIVKDLQEPDLLLSYYQNKAVFYKKTDPDSSINYINRALTIATKNNRFYVCLELLQQLSDLYAITGNYDLAYQIYEKYNDLKDSLSNSPAKSLINSSDTQSYVTDSNSKAYGNGKNLSEIKKDEKTIIILLVIGILFLLISIVLFFWYKFKYQLRPIPLSQKHSFSVKKNQGKGEFFREIVYNLATPIITIDADLNIILANHSFCQLLSYKEHEMNGINFKGLICNHDGKNDRLVGEISDYLENYQNMPVKSVPACFEDKNGSKKDVNVLLSHYTEKSDVYVLIQLIESQHLTDNPAVEKKGKNIHADELLRFYHDLGIKKKTYLRKVYNQYLTSIYHTLIESSVMMTLKRADFLLHDDSVKKPLVAVNISSVYKQLVQYMSKQNDQVRFHQNIKNEKMLMINQGYLYALLYIVFTNALESIRGTGDIYFESLSKENENLFKIADTGEGLSQLHHTKIFIPFFTTKDTVYNQGLGLAVAREIVESHGGKIILKSKYGKGAEVIIKIPRI